MLTDVEGAVDRLDRALDSDQPPVWRRGGHGEAVRFRPGNHGVVIFRRRGKALGELGHAQVFVKVWTLRVIQVVQQLGQLGLIAQRQMKRNLEVAEAHCTHHRSIAVSHRRGRCGASIGCPTAPGGWGGRCCKRCYK